MVVSVHGITRVLEILAPVYDSLINILLGSYSQYMHSLIEFSDLTANDVVLDIGCGTGELEYHLSNYIPCKNIFAVDISEKMVSIAKEKMKEINCPATILVNNAMPLPFEDNKFDIVFTSMVMHHFNDEEKKKVLHEIKRVLKPNGRYVSAEFCSRRNPLIWSVSYNGILKEEHLIDAGFEVIKEEEYKLSIVFRMLSPIKK